MQQNNWLYYLEKTILLVCTCLFFFQIYLSLHTFHQHDFVETKIEEKLYNVDLPMIRICAKKPFLYANDTKGLEANGSFIGWADKNTSTLESLRRRAQVKNYSDLVNVSFSSDDLMYNNESTTLQYERLRIMKIHGQCYSVVLPNEEVEKRLKRSFMFSVTLVLSKSVDVNIYLDDPNVYNGYYNPGNALELNQYQVFDVAITQNEQSPHDPSVHCEEYNSTRGYHDCVTKTAEDKFLSIIGCVPPWFSDNEDLVCQNKDVKSVNQRIKYNRTLYDQHIVGKSSNADKQTFDVQIVKIKK